MARVFKTYPVEARAGQKYPTIDIRTADEGKVSALVSIWDVVDLQGDRVRRGSFEKSLEKWRASGDPIPIVVDHVWGPEGHVGYVDARNVEEIDEGLLARDMMFDMDDPTAARVFRLIKQRRIKEWSFAYDTKREKRLDDGSNELLELDLIEISSTLKGANPFTMTLSAKSARPRSARRSDLATAIMDRITKAMHDENVCSAELWQECAGRAKVAASDPQADFGDVLDDVVQVIRRKRDAARWSKEDRNVLADWQLKGRLDELTASLHVGTKPWRIEKRGDEFCVIKETANSVEKCFDSREEALAYQRALYVHAPEAEKCLDELPVVDVIGSYRILRSGTRYVIVDRNDVPVARRRTLGMAQETARALARDADLRSQVDAIAAEIRGGKAVGAKSATPLADEFIANEKVRSAENRARIEKILETAGPDTRYWYEHRRRPNDFSDDAVENVELNALIEAVGDRPPSERERDEAIARAIEREQTENARKAAERQAEIQREEIRDQVSRDRPWMNGLDAYAERVGAEPMPSTPITYPEPVIHEGVPADIGQTTRVPVGMVDSEVRTAAREPAPLHTAEPTPGETVRLSTAGVVVAEVPTAQPAPEQFRIGTVPEVNARRTVQVESPIPSVDGVSDEPIGWNLVPNPPKPKKKEKK